jgi:MFS family permease
MIGAISLGLLSDNLGRKRVILVSAFPAAVASFIAFYWLQSSIALGVGFFCFGTLKASVPALVVALAQEASSGESSGTASGIIMSLHYTAAVIAPLIAAQLITGTGDIVLAMILASSIPMILYGCLIAAVRERGMKPI